MQLSGISNPFLKTSSPIQAISSKSQQQQGSGVETTGSMASNPFQKSQQMQPEQVMNHLNQHAMYNMAALNMQGTKGSGSIGVETSGTVG